MKSNYEYHILYSSLILKHKLAEQIYEKLYVWVKQFRTSLNIIIIILFRHCYDLVSMDRWILMIFYIWWYVMFQIWPRITRQLTILFVGDTIIRIGNLYQYKSTRIPLGVQYCSGTLFWIQLWHKSSSFFLQFMSISLFAQLMT